MHGLRAVGLSAVAAVLAVAGMDIRRRVIEDRQATAAAGLVQQLLKVDTAQVPGVVRAVESYRRWTDPELFQTMAESSDPKIKLHASLALLPVDATQVRYLETRLLRCHDG